MKKGILLIALIGICYSVQAQDYYFEMTKKSNYFSHGVSDLVAYIDLGDIQIWGWLEVTLTGSYSYQNTIGRYTKRYTIGNNTGSGNPRQSSEVPIAFGPVVDQWKLGNIEKNAQNHLVIPIYHLTSTGNSIVVNIKGVSATYFDTSLFTITPPTTQVNSETKDVIFIKNNITTDGNIGIGTTNPVAKLESITPNGNSQSLRLGRLDNSNYWSVNHAGNDFRLYNSASSGSNVLFGVDPGGNIKNNNVGIGTATPDTKLDVNGSVKIDDEAHSHSNIQLGHEGNDRIYADNSSNKYYGGGMFFRVTPDPTLNISHNYIDVMMLTDKGNVGIGTLDPGLFKLAVNGNIRAKEVKVETGWSDFVFEKTYKLPTLEEVENHIKKNGHLKDIPSAKEVEKNGVLLGQMDSKLLQKIEELTLYTIQQEKKIKSLEKQAVKIEKLEVENQALKAINSKLLELQKRLDKLETKKK